MSQLLEINNLPTPKVEEWKFTNLPAAMPANLALADAPQEVVIHKKPKDQGGEVCEQIEDIVFTASEGQHQQPRLKIVLEEGAELTLVERHDGQGA